ncbi:peptidylprolyl isomerase [Paenibacillus protaetiae]|uniref:peptidylprolyl isomerase n=1 Tax=Paenibacillus protaetiae TaxID=2509456 RepID=A0A4P6F020_9BACL|nr:peptidylprolyl isomerase [Paenibacillus protaetiae]QAY67419.1 peptidylprolyl isomerase [Paenibacillus protaetiae]
MRKYEVLRAVVILQAICMVVLAAVVVVKLLPGQDGSDDSDTKFREGGLAEGSKAVASIGGETVTEKELGQALYDKYGEEVLRTILVHKAIDLEVKKEGITLTSEEQEAELSSLTEGYSSESEYFQMMQDQLGMTKQEVLDDMRYRLLLEKIATQSVTVSKQEIDDYIDAHADSYSDKLQLHLRWIVTSTEQAANSVLDRLAGGEDFAQLAEEQSIDSFTAASGGDLGLIDAKDPFYQPDILDAASRLQTGEYAGPFEVDAGYAVVQLVERRLTKGQDMAEVRKQVEQQLALAKAKPLHDVEDDLLRKYGAVNFP